MDADLFVRQLRKDKIAFEHIRVWDKNTFIKQLKEFTPDFIVADYSLPQFSGIEAYRLMKKEGFNSPFILMTGSVPENIIEEISREGIDAYLLKDKLANLANILRNLARK